MEHSLENINNISLLTPNISNVEEETTLDRDAGDAGDTGDAEKDILKLFVCGQKIGATYFFHNNQLSQQTFISSLHEFVLL